MEGGRLASKIGGIGDRCSVQIGGRLSPKKTGGAEFETHATPPSIVFLGLRHVMLERFSINVRVDSSLDV